MATWYSWLENSIDRGAWQGALHGVAKESDVTEQAHKCVYVSATLSIDQ